MFEIHDHISKKIACRCISIDSILVNASIKNCEKQKIKTIKNKNKNKNPLPLNDTFIFIICVHGVVQLKNIGSSTRILSTTHVGYPFYSTLPYNLDLITTM